MGASARTRDIHIAWPGREEIKGHIEIDDNDIIVRAVLLGIGGPEFLQALADYRGKMKGPLKDLPLPEGVSGAAILLREMALKLKGEWNPPYKDEETCHCRSVPTAIIDLAICTGAHTSRKVTELTSASTGCGTCRPDVEAMIRYRLTGS